MRMRTKESKNRCNERKMERYSKRLLGVGSEFSGNYRTEFGSAYRSRTMDITK